jgi:hypothetical protein
VQPCVAAAGDRGSHTGAMDSDSGDDAAEVLAAVGVRVAELEARMRERDARIAELEAAPSDSRPSRPSSSAVTGAANPLHSNAAASGNFSCMHGGSLDRRNFIISTVRHNRG